MLPLLLLLTMFCVGGCGPGPTSAVAPPPQPTPALATASQAPVSTPATEPPVRQALRLASTRWPPFTDDDGKPRVAIDLVHLALSRAGYQASSTIVPDQTLSDQLRQGAFEGSVAMWQSAEREGFLLFSNAYLENRIVLVGLVGSDVRARSFKALAGKKVGIVAGYAYGPELEAAREPKFVQGASTELNLRALLDRKLDYVLADALLMAHVFEQYPRQANERLVVATEPLITRSLHFVVRKDAPEAQQIIKRFNEEIRLMLADGAYNRALGLDWVSADVDGDGRPELIARTAQVGSRPPPGGYAVSSTPAAGPAPTPETQGYYVAGKR